MDSLSAPDLQPTKAKAAPKGTGEVQEMRGQMTSEEQRLRERGLTKTAHGATKEALTSTAKILKSVVKTVLNAEEMSNAYAKGRQQVVAQSAALAKKLSKLETYSNWSGVRADLLRNQFDGIGHLLSHAMRIGLPDISEGNMMKITPDKRLALHNWLVRSTKLDVGQETAFDVLRVLRGEDLMKETGKMRAKSAQYKAHAATLKQAAKTA